jgi:cytochrome c biogenesis protein ResB
MGRAQTELPFSIELQDFRREMHPGTEMARGFASDVIVHDGGVTWPYHIRMNEPLRYKGYTFYQASFSMRPDGEFSILSVVRNKGRIFPYIASVIIFAGLLLHAVLRLRGAKDGKA